MHKELKQTIFTVSKVDSEGKEEYIVEFDESGIPIETIMSIMNDFVQAYKSTGKQIDLLDMIKEIEEENGRGNKA